MSQAKTAAGTSGVKYGQPGAIGYHAFGSPLAQDFPAIKEADANKMESAYGNNMKIVVTEHSLPLVEIPEFATTMDSLAAGDSIGVIDIFGEFDNYLSTPGTSKAALATTRTQAGGAVLGTPPHAFSTAITESTDELALRTIQLNQYSKMVSEAQAHIRQVVSISSKICADLKARVSIKIRSSLKTMVNVKHPRHSTTTNPPRLH